MALQGVDCPAGDRGSTESDEVADFEKDPDRQKKCDRDSIPDYAQIWVCLHSVAVVILAVRGLYLMIRGSALETTIRFMFALVYFISGVLLPIWSHRMSSNGAFVCLKNHAARYEKKYKERDSSWLDIVGKCASDLPIFHFMSLFSPIRILLLVALHYEEQAKMFFGIRIDSYEVITFTISLIGIGGMLAFSSAHVNEIAVKHCKDCVRGIIDDIIGNTPLEDIWDDHYFVDKTIVRVWSHKSVGAIWVARLVLLFLIGLVLGAASTNETDIRKFVVLLIGAVLFTSFGIYLIHKMTTITSLCQDRRFLKSVEDCCAPGGHNDTVINALRYRLSQSSGSKPEAEVEPTPEMIRRLAFAHYIMSTNMGVHLLGVRMDSVFILKFVKGTLFTFFIPVFFFVSRHAREPNVKPLPPSIVAL